MDAMASQTLLEREASLVVVTLTSAPSVRRSRDIRAQLTMAVWAIQSTLKMETGHRFSITTQAEARPDDKDPSKKAPAITGSTMITTSQARTPSRTRASPAPTETT